MCIIYKIGLQQPLVESGRYGWMQKGLLYVAEPNGPVKTQRPGAHCRSGVSPFQEVEGSALGWRICAGSLNVIWKGNSKDWHSSEEAEARFPFSSPVYFTETINPLVGAAHTQDGSSVFTKFIIPGDPCISRVNVPSSISQSFRDKQNCAKTFN